MAEPPSPKRQRLSDPEPTRSQLTTPTRASYQSPTKASIARSHPNLLPRSPGRNSETYSRGRNLRLSLLANRTISLDGESGTSIPMLQSPKRGTNITSQTPVTIAPDAREGFSAAITRAFTENRPRSSTSARSPLTSRQPSASNPSYADGRSPSPTKAAIPAFMRPRLVPAPSSSSSATRQASSEPSLPPTPVELGLEPPAERPRGLTSSSSSPGRSKSNSGKRRRRQRGNARTDSSPSKLREQVQAEDAIPIDFASFADRDLPVEAPESEIQIPEIEGAPDDLPEIETQVLETDADAQNELPDSIKEKQAKLKKLQTELAQLKADMNRLELMVTKEEPEISPRTLQALTDTTRGVLRSESPDIILPERITMPSNPIPHLTLFTPAGLRIHITSSTATTSTTGLLQIYAIRLHAPSPYPPHIFGATLTVHTNPSTTQIDSLALASWHSDCATTLHAPLRKWVESRLRSPLHNKDASGLIWGIGTYWEFCVRRATVWNTLLTGKLSDEVSTPEELLRWLGRESVDVPVPGTSAGGRRGKGKEGEDMSLSLSWTAELDWTGNIVGENVGISCRGVPVKAHKMVKSVFRGLRKRKGVVAAVEGVVKVLQDG